MTYPLTDIRGDVQLALDLAAGRPTGEVADALRARLKQHLTAFSDPARRYAQTCPDAQVRGAIDRALAHAGELLKLPTDDDAKNPADELRQLARCAMHLSQYTADRLPRPGPPSPPPYPPPT